jgi:hypothetical protein
MRRGSAPRRPPISTKFQKNCPPFPHPQPHPKTPRRPSFISATPPGGTCLSGPSRLPQTHRCGSDKTRAIAQIDNGKDECLARDGNRSEAEKQSPPDHTTRQTKPMARQRSSKPIYSAPPPPSHSFARPAQSLLPWARGKADLPILQSTQSTQSTRSPHPPNSFQHS